MFGGDFMELRILKQMTIKRIVVMSAAMIFIYFVAANMMMAPDEVLPVGSGNYTEQETDAAATSDTYQVVYALHESGYVVKTHALIDPDLSLVESIFDSLLAGVNYLEGDVRGLIPASAELLSYEMDAGVLTLNLSESFLYYLPRDEQHLLSSLVFSMTELVDVERVKFMIEGEPVSNLNSGINTDRGLTRAMGINLEVGTSRPHDAQAMTLYFLTDDSDDALLVPVTRLVSRDVDMLSYAVSSLIMGPIGEHYVSVFDHRTTLLDDPLLADGTLTLNFSADLFYNEAQTQVSSSMLRQLVMTLTAFDDVSDVSVIIEGNVRVFDEGMNPVVVPVSRYDVSSFVQDDVVER